VTWRAKIKELGIEYQEGTTMIKLLEDKVTTKMWNAASLPNDSLSVENGIIMFKSRRWPLMIDPQTQANKFIKNLGKEEAEGGLELGKLSDPNLLRNMELAI
jgi:dynein heavy chain